MRERVALVGGRLQVESAPGSGTTIAAEVPLAVTIRVLVVDDHAVVRAGLRRVLDAETDIETVGEARDAERAVFEALEHKPDVVLMDVVMPGKSGIEGMPALLQAVPGREGARALDAGRPALRARGLRGRRERLRAEGGRRHGGRRRRARSRGRRALRPPALGARLSPPRSEERKRADADPLSEREREVLRLLALGHTNQEIAQLLYISVRTAETHRAHIMQKLGLSSRAELVRYALDHGLVER